MPHFRESDILPAVVSLIIHDAENLSSLFYYFLQYTCIILKNIHKICQESTKLLQNSVISFIIKLYLYK